MKKTEELSRKKLLEKLDRLSKENIELKKIVQQKKKTEEKYRTFFRTSKDCVFITSKAGQWIDLNDSAVELFGYDNKEELRRVRITDLYADPQDRRQHLKAIEEAGFTKNRPTDLVKKDGTVINTLISSVPIRDETGKVVAFQGTIQDVTAEKAARQKMDHLNRILRAIRNVNQLITQGKKQKILLTETCQRLIETRGYEHAFIVLFDKAGTVTDSAQAGLDDSFPAMLKYLERKRPPECFRQALDKSDVLVYNTNSDCYECPLFEDTRENRIMLRRLEYGKKIYGVLAVLLSKTVTIDEDETSLFGEVAADISFALHDIEIEKRRQTNLRLLKESQARLRKAQEIARMGFLDWNLKTDELTLSEEIVELYGVDPHQRWSGQSFARAVVHAADLEFVAGHLQKAASGQENMNIDHRIVRPDGEVLWVNAKTELVRDQEGNPEYLLGTAMDITDRKLAEKDLLETEQRYRTLFETAAEGILIANIKSRKFKYANPSICQLLGYPEEELINMRVDDIHPKESLEHVIAEFEAQARGEKTLAPDIACLRKDKSIVYTNISTVKAVIDGEKCNIGFFTNITELKEAEKNLRESRQFLEDIFESIQDGISVLNPDLTIRHVNGVMKKWYADRLPLEGRKCYEVYHKKKKACVSCPTLQCLKTGKTEREVVPGPKDSDIEWIELFSYPMKDAVTGEITGIVEFVRDITKRRQAEQALQDSEAKYRVLVESAADAIYVVNKDLQYLHGNTRYLKRRGLTLKELQGKVYGEFHSEAGTDKFMERVHTVYETGKPVIYEYQSEIDGRYYIRTISPITAPETKKVESIVVISKDITDFKQIERQLAESEERYRLIVEHAHDGIEITQDDRLIFFNAQFARMLGYTVDELKNIKFSKIFTRQATKELYERKQKRERGESLSHHYETTFRKKDGTIINVEVSYEIIEYRGRPATFAIIRDITEWKKAMDTIKSSEQRFRSVFQFAPFGMALLDYKGVLLEVNPAMTKIYGGSESRLVGKHFSKINVFDPKQIPGIFKLYKNIIMGESIATELKVRDANNRQIIIECYAARFGEGKNRGILAMIQDITQRKKTEAERDDMQQQLYQAQKMEAVGQLTGGVAHDFNNILTVINGHCQILLQTLTKSDPEYDSISKIYEAGKRAAKLIRQLLAYSRKQMIQKENIDLNDIIKSLDKMLRRLIGEDIRLTIKSPDIPIYVSADPGQIEQIIMNLIVNARDAQPEGGSVQIEIGRVELNEKDCRRLPESRPGKFVFVRIADKGVGMSAKTMAHIFEPFYTTKGRARGTGLGLSVVYGIVKQHDGWINVDSTPGEGSTFTFYLPAILEGDQTGISALDKDKIPRGNGERILLVEDEEEVLQVAENILKDFGYKIKSATNVEEALQAFSKSPRSFDLILSDVILPNGTGIEVIKEVLRVNPKQKIIMFSGYAGDRSKIAEIRERGYPFLQKPFEINKLLETIADILGQKR